MKNNFKYIIKDNLNTYINMVDSEKEVYQVLNKMSEQFKDTFSTFGGSLDGPPIYEDSAVYRIPYDMKPNYNNENHIKFYFFKFDIETNKIVKLY